VLALAGVSHLVRTWGVWRLTLGDDQHKISFFAHGGSSAGAEAAGQLGILGADPLEIRSESRAGA